MKIFFALLSFFPMLVISQSWCPPGATWKFDTGSPWSTSHTRWEYAGDTLIDGFEAQKITHSSVLMNPAWIPQDTLIYSVSPSYFTRTNNDVVWQYNGTSWDTLYWFSALPGDQWSAIDGFISNEPCETAKWVVIDTFTTYIDGYPLRALSVGIDYGSGEILIGETVIERLGGDGLAIFPGSTGCGNVVLETNYTRICYSDVDIYPTSNCSITLGVREWGAPTAPLELFPQPAIDQVTISIPDGTQPVALKILDAHGKTVLAGPAFRSSKFMLDVSGLTPGYYVLSTTDVNGEVLSAPLLIGQ